MRRLIDGLITGIALFFLIPTFLILISWNAIPGDNLYTLKTGLEDAALILLSGTPLVPKVSIQFTNRRLGEASKLLDTKGSTVGYDLLVAEARQTQNYLVSKNDKVDSAVFIQNINDYKKQIAQQRARALAQAKASGKTIPVATPKPVNPTPAPSGQSIIVNVPTQEIITQEPPDQVVQNLDNTENQLNQIQDQLQSESTFVPEPTSTPTPAPTQGFGGQGFGQGEGGGRGHNQNQQQNNPTATPIPTTAPTQTTTPTQSPSGGNNFNFPNH